MKKIFTILGLSAALFSNAQQLLSEPFNFTGAVSGQNGWSTHSGTTPGQIVTTPGSLVYSGIPSTGNSAATSSTSTEDINKALTSAVTTGVVYYSALINPLNTTALNANTASGDYFLHLGSMSTGTNPSLLIFSSRLYIKKGVGTDTVNIGVLNGSGGTATPSYSSVDYPINQTIYVVVKYDLASNTSTLYINPSPGSEPSVGSATNNTGTAAAPASIGYFCIREGSGTGNIQLDELKVSTTYSGLLAVSHVNSAKVNLVKNTNLGHAIVFGTKANVQIVNANGQVVKSAAVSENTSLDVSSFAKGMYIVTGEVNGQKVSEKVIKN